MKETSPVSGRRALIEAVVASTVGTTIEWYDFFLYGTAAAMVFPQLFFPDFDPFVGQILSFGTFSVGFLARPLGGVLFGHLGDRIGRKTTLVATLLLMGLSTVLIGLLPTYGRIGLAAPLILTVLRFLQGLGVGGEWGGAVLLALESGHRGKRGFLASWPQTGVPLGLLLSTAMMTAMKSVLPEEDFRSWGWRVPFLLSALLIVLGFAIRARVAEPALFRELQRSQQVAEAPLGETLRRHWREVLLAAGSRMGENSCFYLFTAYAIAYVHKVLGVDERVVLNAVLLAAGLELLVTPLYGVLSDYWSRKGMYMTGCVCLMLFAFPYYALLETRRTELVVTAVVLSLVGAHAILYSVQASLIPELFGTRLRYTGASLGYQLGAPLAGGLAPLIAATIVQAYPGQSWLLALYIVLVALISLVCVHFLAETSRKDISADA
jgi:metabolite-proton symporter